MAGIIGKKIGMSSFFSKDGKSIPCTMIEAGPCVVTQIKEIENLQNGKLKVVVKNEDIIKDYNVDFDGNR